MSDDLLCAPITERDWQARAWERLRDVRAKHLGWTLDDALADPVVGRVVRGMAATLKREHDEREARTEKEARFGRKATFNGYGYVPLHSTRRLS